MKIRFPLMILGYSPSRVFSTEHDDGSVYLPVFNDPEKAEAYRRFFAREFHQALNAYVIEDVNQAIPFFNLLLATDHELQEILIDPPPPVDGKKGGLPILFQNFLENLVRQHRARANRRHRRRRGDNHRPIHTKKV